MGVLDPSRIVGENPGGAPEAEPEFELTVSTDRMTTYLRVKPAYPNQEIKSDKILDFLQKNGISYGILRDDIERFCQEKRFFTELVCARGLEPVDEEDARMEYCFRAGEDALPMQKEDGTVDFHELGTVQSVKKGDVLCRIVLPEKGKDGIDVFNHAVAFQHGRVPEFPSGENTVISEDRLTLSSLIDGCIEFKKSVLNVNNVFVVHGNVDSASGNIDFLGAVTVQGDVLEGFSVKAGKDIVVRGMVEGARLESGGDIIISKGMKGMGRGRLVSAGNIVGKYFENVTMECGGDVCADIIMNSMIRAAGSVLLRGRNALLLGGRTQSGCRIDAGCIGNRNGARTDTVIVSEKLQNLLLESGESPAVLQARLDNVYKEDSGLRDRIRTYTDMLSVGKGDTARIQSALKNLILQKGRNAETVHNLKKQIQEAQARQASYMDFHVAGIHTIYAGTKIAIGNFTQLLNNDYSYTKFYSEREGLVNGPLMPSDIQSY